MTIMASYPHQIQCIYGFFYWIEVNSTIPVVIFAAGVLNLINAQYNVEFFFLMIFWKMKRFCRYGHLIK